MAAGTKSAVVNGYGSGWPRRWWERMFAVVLILIAVVAAIILFLGIVRYCECRTWPDWWAGFPCPYSCNPPTPPVGGGFWLSSARAKCTTALNGYTGAQPIGPGEWHHRAFFSRGSEPIQVFVAERSIRPVNVSMWPVVSGVPAGPPIFCRATGSDSAPDSGYPGQTIWEHRCEVPAVQSVSGPYGVGFYYNVVVSNDAVRPEDTANYCWYAVCDNKFPANNSCADPRRDDNLGPGYYSSGSPGGYPSTGGYPSGGAYSPPYPGSTYPGSTYPGSPPSGGSSYPSSGSTYRGSSTPGTTLSSPPPASTGTGTTGGSGQ